MESLSTPPTSLLSRHSSSRAFSSNVEGIRRISSVCPSASYTLPSRISCQTQHATSPFSFSRKFLGGITSKRLSFMIPRSTGSSQSGEEGSEDSSATKEKVPFGYTRKDVLLIGLGVTVIGVGLKSGLEYAGVDPLQAGNVVQLVIVLGLTVGWISTYMFRVSNKEMTYVQQLRDYENKVMEKRLEGLTEAELQTLLAQVEEEKQRVPSSEQVN